MYIEDVMRERGPLYAADLCFSLPAGSRVMGALDGSLRFEPLAARAVDILTDISWQIGGRGDRPAHLLSPKHGYDNGIEAIDVDELKDILGRPRQVVANG